MKILLLGSGAREHALARCLASDPATSELVVAPGNPGTAAVATNLAIDPASPTEVVELVAQMSPDLVVVGPEAPLVAGVADAVRASLQAIGYQPTPLLAEGAEDALIVTHAAFPQHAVMARTRTGRIELDALRIAGPADTAADTQAEKALRDALAAFRAELEKRGIRQNRVSHLPAGLRPLAHQQVTRRATEQRRTTEQEQRR